MQLNVDWIYRLPAPIRRAAYFGLQETGGFRISSAWGDFQKWEKFSPSQLAQAVEQRLSVLLHSAVKNSPHYQMLGLVRKSAETAEEFIRRFPILTREKVRSDFGEIVVRNLRDVITSPSATARKRNDWLVVKTGGTTGTPTSVIHDIKFRNSGRATRLAAARMCGLPLGTRYFRLWGSEQDLLQQNEKLDRRILRNLLGEIPMNAFRAKELELQQHWRTLIENSHVQHMMAYVDAAVSLALFIGDRNLERPKLKTIMACAGTVTPEWRKILQKTFSADVYDKYGSRECADIACECSAHRGLHVFSSHVFVEILDEQGKLCPPGKMGRIVVTMLNNLSFPMIRYEIGDLGIWSEPSPCPCGSAFPRIQSLQGRQDDMLTTKDGTLLSSVFVRHFIGVSLNRQLIREWQLEQVGINRFKFRYVAMNSVGITNNLHEIKCSFHKALGHTAQIEFVPVTEIPPSASGKTLWIINRMKP